METPKNQQPTVSQAPALPEEIEWTEEDEAAADRAAEEIRRSLKRQPTKQEK